MTTQTDPRIAARQVVAGLTAPGAPFELVVEDVLGAPVQLFVNRRRALHELLAESLQHGDRTYLATLEERITFAEHAASVSSLAQALRDEYGVRPGERVAILAADGGDEPLAPGKEGVIAVHRSDQGLMIGYWNRPDEEAEVMRGEWFAGGDLGSMNEDGYVTHLGRAIRTCPGRR